MTTKLVIAIALIVLGIVAFAYGGISYTRQKKVVDVGPVTITREQHETVPLPPVVGGVCLVSGVVLLMFDRRRRA